MPSLCPGAHGKRDLALLSLGFGTRMSQDVSKWLVNGLFHLLINGIYWVYSPLILTIDPNFLGHPSTGIRFFLTFIDVVNV